jgi:hypothetical protein
MDSLGWWSGFVGGHLKTTSVCKTLVTAFEGSKQLFAFDFLPIRFQLKEKTKAMCCLVVVAKELVGI